MIIVANSSASFRMMFALEMRPFVLLRLEIARCGYAEIASMLIVVMEFQRKDEWFGPIAEKQGGHKCSVAKLADDTYTMILWVMATLRR